MKRAIKLEGTDIELVISKSTLLHVPSQFLYLWKLDDGTWFLERSAAFLPDFAIIKEFLFKEAEQPALKKKRLYPGVIDVVAHNQSSEADVAYRKMHFRKISAITNGNRGKPFIHFEMRDGFWQLTYWKSEIPELEKVTGFTIVRED